MRCHSLHLPRLLPLLALAACSSAGVAPDVRPRGAGALTEGRVRLQLVAAPSTGIEQDSLVVLLEVQGAAGAMALTLTYAQDQFEAGDVRAAAGVMLFRASPQPGLLRVAVVGQGAMPAAPLRVAFARRGADGGMPQLLRADVASAQGSPMTVDLAPAARRRPTRVDESYPIRPAEMPAEPATSGLNVLAPGVARFGDINGDGRVSVADVVLLGQATVGVRTIVGDAFVAANVAPSGAAGRPTGTDADGQTRLSVSDLTLLNQATVGVLIGAVGQVIPIPALGPRLLVTPIASPVAARTEQCTARLAAGGPPFANAASGEPWPECRAADGLPMVVQFCIYEKLADLRWRADLATATAARCQAELAQVQRGGL